MKTRNERITQETDNFLEMVLFLYNWEYSDLEESDYSIDMISDESKKYARQFVRRFCDHLYTWYYELFRDVFLDTILERSFGGNVYASLTGHGIGFFDEYSHLSDLQTILEDWVDDSCFFDHVEIEKLEDGTIDILFPAIK